MASINIPTLNAEQWNSDKMRHLAPCDEGYDLLTLLANRADDLSRYNYDADKDSGVLVQPWVLGLLARRLKEISDRLGLGPLQPLD